MSSWGMVGTRKIYKGVYLVKLIMAYFVVAIHTTNWSLMGLLDTAVPYFFLASGFFLFRKLGGSMEEDLAVIRRWTLNVLKLYLIWTAIYLPFTIVGYFKSGLSLPVYILAFFRNLIFFGENYLSWPLWYLLALVWDGVLIYIMRRLKMPVWGMFLIGLAMYLGARIFDVHRIPYYTKLFLTIRNGLFFGLAFVTAGGLIQQMTEKAQKSWSVWWDILLVIASFVGFQFSHWFLLPLAIGIFLVSLRLNWPANESIARRIGAMSKVIYLTHMLFAGLLILLAGLSHNWALYVATAVAATLLAFLSSGPWKETKVNRYLQLA